MIVDPVAIVRTAAKDLSTMIRRIYVAEDKIPIVNGFQGMIIR